MGGSLVSDEPPLPQRERERCSEKNNLMPFLRDKVNVTCVLYCYTPIICWFILRIDLEIAEQHTLCRFTSIRTILYFIVRIQSAIE